MGRSWFAVTGLPLVAIILSLVGIVAGIAAHNWEAALWAFTAGNWAGAALFRGNTR